MSSDLDVRTHFFSQHQLNLRMLQICVGRWNYVKRSQTPKPCANHLCNGRDDLPAASGLQTLERLAHRRNLSFNENIAIMCH